MSGIYGIFCLDRSPVFPKNLAAMRASMAYYGPDGGSTWHHGPIGMGQLLLKVTPEDEFEEQPVVSPGIVLVSTGRLDYREELWQDLAIRPSERNLPDSALIMKAYRRWGEACVDHLLGDWSFALWDIALQKLLLARDPHGNTALYFHRNAHRFAFASSIKGILALDDTPRRPDLLQVAKTLVSWPSDGMRTAYQEIETLPPAHVVLLDIRGIKKRRYWIPEQLSSLQLPRDEDYVEQFLHIYGQAVKTRLRSAKPIGITLSAGLDSGSVAALAGPLLRQQGRGLTAFTAIPKYNQPSCMRSNRLSNEWELAQATARMAGISQHLPERAEKIGLLESIRRHCQLHGYPTLAAGNSHWILAILEASSAKQLGVLLTGQQGNGSVSFSGEADWWLSLFRGDLRQTWQIFWKSESSLWQTLQNQLWKPILLPKSLARVYRYHVLGRGTPWSAYSAIHPKMAQQVSLGSHMRQEKYDPTFSSLNRKLGKNVLTLRLSSSTAGASWHELGSGYNLETRDPTADRKVIEFCIRCPNTQYRRNGQERMLIRRAMVGRMPPEVLHSPLRGIQSADLVLRILAERDQMKATIRQLGQHPLTAECLDIPRMERILATLCKNSAPSAQKICAPILLRGTMAGSFLQQF